MFVETGKKLKESFSETKNQTSVVFVIQKCSYLGICKHEFKFTCSGYCRFTFKLDKNWLYPAPVSVMEAGFGLSLQTSFLMYSSAHCTVNLAL